MQRWRRIGRWGVRLAALAFGLQLAVALWGVPPFIRGWFMCAPGLESPAAPTPDFIIVLGGGGIPSASGLTRTYHAITLHRRYPAARFIVSLPSDGDPATNSVGRMRDELVLHGVPAETVQLEWAALNTHEQAVNVARLLGAAGRTSEVRIVTNPWHLRRSLACFRKAGFTHARAEGAASIGAEADPGAGTLWRYGIWANAADGVDCLREACALLIYRIRDWV